MMGQILMVKATTQYIASDDPGSFSDIGDDSNSEDDFVVHPNSCIRFDVHAHILEFLVGMTFANFTLDCTKTKKDFTLGCKEMKMENVFDVNKNGEMTRILNINLQTRITQLDSK